MSKNLFLLSWPLFDINWSIFDYIIIIFINKSINNNKIQRFQSMSGLNAKFCQNRQQNHLRSVVTHSTLFLFFLNPVNNSFAKFWSIFAEDQCLIFNCCKQSLFGFRRFGFRRFGFRTFTVLLLACFSLLQVRCKYG